MLYASIYVFNRRAASDYCYNLMKQDFDNAFLDPYDIRHPPNDTTSEDAGRIMSNWLNKKEIQEQLGVERNFIGCNDNVGEDFRKRGDTMHPTVKIIPSLL